MPRLFLVFVTNISQLKFLRAFPQTAIAVTSSQSVQFSTEDDLDLVLYYLRTLSNIFRWAPDAFWGVLATRIIEEPDQHIREIGEQIQAFDIP